MTFVLYTSWCGHITALSIHYTKAFAGDQRSKLADVIKEEAGAILVIIIQRYREMLEMAPENSILADWRPFMPFLQQQAAASDPLPELQY